MSRHLEEAAPIFIRQKAQAHGARIALQQFPMGDPVQNWALPDMSPFGTF
jgi:hypothetical protein